MATEALQIQTLYDGPRGTAIKILNRVERTDSYLDKLLDTELRATDISDLDKSLLAEIVHGVMRWQGRLDWILNGFTHGNFTKSDVNVKNALRVALYQILFLNHVPHYAVVNEAVEFIKRIRGGKLADFVNAVLRNIIRNIDGIHYPKQEDDPIQWLAVYYSHPQWMVKRWYQRFTREELEKFLQTNNEVPGLTLRINKLKINPTEFLSLLDMQKIPYQGSSLIDYFIRVKSLSGISQLNIFQSGYFSIQDESAALPVLLLDPKPGEDVIDMCAAPGGKTTFIAELMRNQGRITAVDKYESKLMLIRTSCDRLGITNVYPMVCDAADLDMRPVDKILVDAPCSGLGALRKKPDIKWKRVPEDIPQLAKLQQRLLENAARLVKPGGTIVYSTCTTEPEENAFVVKSFLEQHPEFHLEDPSGLVNRAVVTQEGFIETFPHRDHIDGSFAARLVKSLSTLPH
ncbi:MAG: 16S rRNA (cytosine(967)-C(5))-methyltransferase RsmB [Ignavibacteriae bacterium]|nr:16S rRNA (cytosine(967)-C(5))-methyltransferase RsmB [Ignavibacteria bacterium]MBI3365241.1 16S rRNA (cytosine(967)-C(5))-methyltransferase RsmB [Ignavibacteriota bacterium]